MNQRIVLIADDDESDVLFLRQALLETCQGIRIEDVSDGEEAIDYLSGRAKYADRKRYPFPTHLFLDVKMPRRTGLEVLRWIRRRAGIAQLPVIVISGSQLAGDREEAERLGAEYIVKPVDYRALLDIARHFREKSGC